MCVIVRACTYIPYQFWVVMYIRVCVYPSTYFRVYIHDNTHAIIFCMLVCVCIHAHIPLWKPNCCPPDRKSVV